MNTKRNSCEVINCLHLQTFFSAMMRLQMSNHELCKILWEDNSGKHSKEHKLNLILEKINESNSYNEDQMKIIRIEMSRKFLSYYLTKWHDSQVCRRKEKFEQIHGQWLTSKFTVEIDGSAADENQDLGQDSEESHQDEGRPDNDNTYFDIGEEMEIDDLHNLEDQNNASAN